jgi:chromosome segregation ATPase
MASAVSKNNELLTLWLRASGGLPADEARALVERLAELEEEAAAEAEELATAQRELEELRSENVDLEDTLRRLKEDIRALIN